MINILPSQHRAFQLGYRLKISSSRVCECCYVLFERKEGTPEFSYIPDAELLDIVEVVSGSRESVCLREL